MYLDVRPSLELEEVGKVKGSVNVPIKNSKRVWSPEEKKKVIQKEDNPDFVKQVGATPANYVYTKATAVIRCYDARVAAADLVVR